jgi:hypothetical protein
MMSTRISQQVRRFAICAALGLSPMVFTASAFGGPTTYPSPSIYPISWELQFDHDLPKRIVVETPDSNVPSAYWYMKYTVTNKTDKEQIFLPHFDMVSRTGQVIRSDFNIPEKVFDEIKLREGDQFLEPFTKVGGEIRLGEDEAKDGVAIWKEPDPRMGNFIIFVGGLSGEAVQMKDDSGQPMKDADGNPIILRKTLQLNYLIRGDDVYPGQEDVNVKSEEEVMR